MGHYYQHINKQRIRLDNSKIYLKGKDLSLRTK